MKAIVYISAMILAVATLGTMIAPQSIFDASNKTTSLGFPVSYEKTKMVMAEQYHNGQPMDLFELDSSGSLSSLPSFDAAQIEKVKKVNKSQTSGWTHETARDRTVWHYTPAKQTVQNVQPRTTVSSCNTRYYYQQPVTYTYSRRYNYVCGQPVRNTIRAIGNACCCR